MKNPILLLIAGIIFSLMIVTAVDISGGDESNDIGVQIEPESAPIFSNATFNQSLTSELYVLKSGDYMSGNLWINNTSPTLYFNDTNGGLGDGFLSYLKADSEALSIYVGTDGSYSFSEYAFTSGKPALLIESSTSAFQIQDDASVQQLNVDTIGDIMDFVGTIYASSDICITDGKCLSNAFTNLTNIAYLNNTQIFTGNNNFTGQIYTTNIVNFSNGAFHCSQVSGVWRCAMGGNYVGNPAGLLTIGSNLYFTTDTIGTATGNLVVSSAKNFTFSSVDTSSNLDFLFGGKVTFYSEASNLQPSKAVNMPNNFTLGTLSNCGIGCAKRNESLQYFTNADMSVNVSYRGKVIENYLPSGVINIYNFTGGTMLKINPNSTINVQNIDVKNNFTGNQFYGQIYNKSQTGYTLGLTTTDVYVQVNGMVSGDNNGWRLQGNGTQALISGTYAVDWQLTFNGDNGEYGASIFKNGVQETDCYNLGFGISTDQHFSGSCFVTVAQWDNLTLEMDDHANPVSSPTIHIANIRTLRVGT